jgi:hypothetical protein
MKIGFSTGDLYTKSSLEIKKGLKNLKKIGSTAVEISVWDGIDGSSLDKINKDDLDGFEYISLHAPGGPYKKDNRTIKFLNRLNEINNELKLDQIIFHPDEIEDKSVFNNYSLPIAIENMDWRKASGKSVQGIKKIFEGNNFGFVLDINHVFTVDKSLNRVNIFYKEFKDKIKEIHLSGFREIHDPLYLTKQDEIIKAIPDKRLPIIIESFKSPYLDLDKAEKEFNYILERL